MSESARWSVMDRETRALIERERARDEAMDGQEWRTVGEVERGVWYVWVAEQDRQTGADEQETARQEQGKTEAMKSSRE